MLSDFYILQNNLPNILASLVQIASGTHFALQMCVDLTTASLAAMQYVLYGGCFV